jgi:REP element-mobilizing transposase RayT
MPHAHYIVTTVVHARRRLLSRREAWGVVADEIARLEHAGAVENLAWIVMPDHVHWLLALREGPLSRVVQQMKSNAARRLNALCGWPPPFWQAGFFDHRLRSDEDLRRQAEYLLANPVRAGLVPTAADYAARFSRWAPEPSAADPGPGGPRLP